MNIDLINLGFSGIITFGIVSAVSFFKADLTTQQKFLLSAVVAFALTFVPREFGNDIANKIKDAIVVATSVNGVFQGAKKILG